MGCKLTWWGHSTWSLQAAGKTILVDPFFDQNPSSPIKAADVQCDAILVTHGHFDHVADLVPIAKRTGAPVYAVFEIANWVGEQGVSGAVGMNLGGATQLDWAEVKMVPALHSSQLPDGRPGGVAAGFVVTVEHQRIYFAGDTSLMTEMQWIGRQGLDVAILPIGDLFTMGPEDSVAALDWLRPRWVLPTHYNTWPPIAQNADDWARLVRSQTTCQPSVLKPGGTFDLPEAN